MNENRPPFEAIKTGKEFNTWYWLKEELVALCKQAGLPHTGSKSELRDRIMYALDHAGASKPRVAKQPKRSRFNWAKEELNPDTLITDNVSFGPNFRAFMKAEIGAKFSCHSDFMDWVKAHPGKSLGDAVKQWQLLDERKKDPDFKRKIAANNMYNQYTRDFLADNPGMALKEARHYWLLKKQLPTKDGFVRYEASDLSLKPK